VCSGGWSNIGLPLKKSCGADSFAFLTAPSNRSNSTSLIALFEGAEIPNVRIVIFPKIIDAISGPDCVLLIALNGREIGTFSTE
jgi:hypothetical protein